MGVSGWNIERLILSPHIPPPLLGSGLGSGCISWQPELTHVMPTPISGIRKHVLRILRDSLFPSHRQEAEA